jgi:hypothetical protein
MTERNDALDAARYRALRRPDFFADVFGDDGWSILSGATLDQAVDEAMAKDTLDDTARGAGGFSSSGMGSAAA